MHDLLVSATFFYLLDFESCSNLTLLDILGIRVTRKDVVQGHDHAFELWCSLFIQNLLNNLKGFLGDNEFGLAGGLSECFKNSKAE